MDLRSWGRGTLTGKSSVPSCLPPSHPNVGRSASPTTGKVCEAKDCVRRVFGEEAESQNYAS